MMDTSKEYILMCERNPDLQESWKPKRGDYIQFGKGIQIVSYCPSEYPHIFNTIESNLACLPAYNTEYQKQHITWLPRQDQLQEMLDIQPLKRAVTQFSIFACSVITNAPAIDRPSNQFVSMEQLWLALVMKEKFGKTWNGEGWNKF